MNTMSENRKIAQMSPTFCIMPFTHIDTKTNGEFKLCCRSLPIYNVRDKRLGDVWNSEKYRRIRKQMLSGEWPEECIGCFHHENNGVRSMRQRQNLIKLSDDYMEVLDDLREDYSMPFKLLSIELKLSNLCNLKCRMCHPVDSIKWAKDWPLISHLQKENEWTYNNVKDYNLVNRPYLQEWENSSSFFEDIEITKGSLKTVWFAGGEPLIDPLHYIVLDKLKNRGIDLQYATNLTKTTFKGESIVDIWKHFRDVLVAVSFDGLYDVFNYIRTGSKFESVVENINSIKNESNITVTGACTFQIYNVFDLPEIFDFLLDNKIWIHSHHVSYPLFLSCQALPTRLKRLASKTIGEYIESVKKRRLESTLRKNIIKHATDCLNFMNSKDLSHLWAQFLEYSKILDDNIKGKTLEEIRPEIKEYINDK